MTTRSWNSFIIATGALIACAATALAKPIDFNEVSLLVRARQSENAIVREVHERKLTRALTPDQESRLRSQGASDSLVQSIRSTAIANAEAESSAPEAQSRHSRNTSRDDHADNAAAEDVHVINVSLGHPINLSQWGGPDYEVAFQSHRYAGEDIVQPIATPSCRTYVDTAVYLGAGRQEDSTTVFDDRNYVSIMSHSGSRPLSIDTKNPVWVKGVPYTMYPVYGAGGVSLYYIGKSGDSVRLAVMNSRM